MSSCRNALEELVIEEAESQYKRLGADVKKRVDLSEVIAYTLNRLPPMYATTQRGWIQQRKKADQELGSAIAKTVRNGFLSTQSDVLRQTDPIPAHELISQARSLVKLRKLFNKEYLKWKDVPDAVRDALDSGYYQGLANGTYVSLDRRNSLLARSYAVRRKPTPILGNGAKTLKTEKDISAEIKDFESYMSGTVYRYSNILESLVAAIVERRVQRLDETIKQKISIDDVAAYVLNRLPPMYATSRRGLQSLRQRVKSDMTNQIISIVKEALNKVIQAPERALSPLPFEKFNLELEDTLIQLRKMLGREDITWRNVAETVEECLRAPKTTYPTWRAKHDV
ncbi:MULTISPECIES: late competence development ComFB family protein [Pseudanabaena]|uniref:Late competence development protein ComFB n=2 Tax=Pseudanabaena TaxID=1152 RepID=L8N3P0_9CYAN|nr:MULTISPECIES: late competence development ComFB family protein [Pseudanabaena]ELS32883.1 Late competence development protein ComFB [Pseudanabaena biceps PCC 7429]MDG3494895.1 late competence development ComFB family protein [Pseudanabaena catenata USMAC16]